MLFIDSPIGSGIAINLFCIGMLCGALLFYAIVKWNEVPSQPKKWNDFDPQPMPPPPLKRPEVKITVAEIFNQIAVQEYDKQLWVKVARIYQKRQCELEKLLKENNIPFEKLGHSEAIEKAKQYVRF